eukprot:GILK01010012.1.p1 GENE.GILK01010012.1~~GILK01010012.1.p1  ORF type:complete len:153 (-),score=16.40 GILK01010012.1:125-583(-)
MASTAVSNTSKVEQVVREDPQAAAKKRYIEKVYLLGRVFGVSTKYSHPPRPQRGAWKFTEDDLECLEDEIEDLDRQCHEHRSQYKRKAEEFHEQIKRLKASENSEELNDIRKEGQESGWVPILHPSLVKPEQLNKLPRLPFNSGENVQICNL